MEGYNPRPRPLSNSGTDRKNQLLLLIPLALLLLPLAATFPHPPGSAYSDITIAHYPNTLFLRRFLAREHRLPLWYPLIYCGYPFLAHPHSGVWYPPGWPALFLPLPAGFNLLILLHLWWSGMGMYRLLRAEGRSEVASLTGALGWELLPALFARYGAGHLTFIYATSWWPWLLLGHRLKRSVLSACALALSLLAAPQGGAYGAALWLIVSILEGAQGGVRELAGTLLRRAGEALTAFLLASPLLIPLLEFTAHSTRSLMTPQDVLIYSIPIPGLFGLLLPSTAFYEWVLYPGAGPLLLGSIALSLAIGRKGKSPLHRSTLRWGVIGLIGILWSLGKHLPGGNLLAGLPGVNLLRVPARGALWTGMAFAALAATGLDLILTGDANCRRSRIAVVALVGMELMMGVGLILLRAPARWLLPTMVAMLAGGLVLVKPLRGARPSRRWLFTWLIIFTLEPMITDRLRVVPLRAEEVMSQGRAAAEYIAAQAREPFRVYSPSYSIPQHIAAFYGLELADGVDPMQLASYARFMEKATGVPFTGYSVTIPPFATGNPAADNRAYRPVPELLGLLNVRYVASAFPLEVKGLRKLTTLDGVWIYENEAFQPRARVVTSEGGQKAIRPARLILTKPDYILVEAEGPGTLVLAEVAYPGWTATVDSRPVPVRTSEGILRSVELGPGRHRVEFRFHPRSLTAGALAGLTGLIIILVVLRRR